jgi:hypothetical protein
MPLLQEPAAIERVHLNSDKPGCVPDVVEPPGRKKVRSFVELEDRRSLFRFPRDTLGVSKAIGHAGEKLAGKVLSGCESFSHQSTR